MFKAQVVRRGFSLWTRRPPSHIIRSAARNGHDTVRIQRVRVVKPLFSRSRLINAAFTIVFGYGLLKTLDKGLDILDNALDPPTQTSGDEKEADNDKAGKWVTAGEDEEDQEQEEEEEEEMESLLFFPTGLSRPKPMTFYKASDPEWQAFRRLSKDRELQARIKDSVVEELRFRLIEAEKSSPSLRRRVGVTDFRGEHKAFPMLDVIYPPGPPLEYERPGIEVREDLSVCRSSRPVDPVVHRRMNNYLYPAGAVKSVYAHAREKTVKHWNTLTTGFGLWNEKSGESSSQEKLQIHGPASSGSKPTTSGPGPQPPAGLAPSPAAETSASQESTPQARLPASPGNSTGSITDLVGRFAPKPSDLLLDLSAFREAFPRKSYIPPPPRGMVLITGVVRIQGKAAIAIFDVDAWYDPATHRHRLVNASWRRVVPLRQPPRGGP